jgi:hypothetical protein
MGSCFVERAVGQREQMGIEAACRSRVQAELTTASAQE